MRRQLITDGTTVPEVRHVAHALRCFAFHTMARSLRCPWRVHLHGATGLCRVVSDAWCPS